jgi:hypothetical protein
MNDANGYAVFFFPQALEALGDAIKPYLQGGKAGEHVLCNEIDTSGSLIEMTMRGTTNEGKTVVMELMVPVSMVRMIVSSQSDGMFGFGPRLAEAVLPPIGPTAEPATAQTAAVPEGGVPSAARESVASSADAAAKPSP